METASQTLGLLGEELAFHFLSAQGYKILLKNYECLFGEIDLVAKEGGSLVFIEVKTRSSEAKGVPAEAVTPHKRRQIVKGAAYYLQRYRMLDAPCRFDVVSVWMLPGEETRLEIIRDAFVER